MKSNPGDGARYVYRDGQRFDTRLAETVVKTQGFVYDEEIKPQNFFAKLGMCCFRKSVADYTKLNARAAQSASSPDNDFCADSLVKLTNGVTAYRLTEPATTTNENADLLPVVVCLHDFTNSSYMWADAVDLLADCDQGPQARVLVLDFYGRGRSPWTGVPCSLEVFVLQVKELLDCEFRRSSRASDIIYELLAHFLFPLPHPVLGLSRAPVQLIGQGMGCVVATGFAAKYPSLAASMTLISPMGISYMEIENERRLKMKYVGEYYWSTAKRNILVEGEVFFYDTSAEAPHRYHIDKQIAMVQWQMENTPGYLGALLSSIRTFPLRSMEELYAAVGRHPRSVLIILGDQDVVTEYTGVTSSMEACFEKGTIVDIRDAGHNPVAEKFNETMLEILSFAKEVVYQRNSRQDEEKF